ncbi:penicillin-binding transpeptidase domain-containing protein [Mariniluteicoccus flavus]
MGSLRRRAAGLSAVVALSLGVASCGTPGGAPPPPKDGPDPAPAIEQLAAGLGRGDLTGTAATVDPNPQLAEILRGMDGLRPQVTVTGQRRTGPDVTVDLAYRWPFAPNAWTYATTAGLTWKNDAWTLVWQPSVVHPALRVDTRLVHTSGQADRGRITGAGGTPLTETQQLARVGIDKARVPADQAEAAAQRLATAYGVDAERYAAAVRGAGPQQFVEAITVRANHPDPAGWRDIPGAIKVAVRRSVAVDRELAPEIIGTVAEATPQQVAESRGGLFPGDQAGSTGLQKRWDESLRGRPSTRVAIVPRAATPSPTASPGATPAPAPSPSAPPEVVFESPATPGQDLATSLDLELQKKAETVMARVPGAASLVAIRPSTGRVVAAANAAGSNGNPDATFGKYAPGSTFKVVTALALLRSGLTPDSPLKCTETVTVDGRTFKNYSDFPASRIGTLSLAQALAYSCNTALIAEHQRVSPAQLRDAAASLGLGQDFDAGFPSFFGQAGEPANVVGLAETMIGQGKAEASPMAMAAVAASVRAGHTVIPQLIDAKAPPAPRVPLTTGEADALGRMMRGVVDGGTGASLRGVAQGAKTGTAEYGTATPPRTHAWMIAYADDLAVAVWVADGDSGSTTAGPIVKAFLG